MKLTLDETVEEMALFPSDVSAELVERILIRCQGGIESSIEAAWQAETSSRVAKIMSDKVEGIPLEESLARAARLFRD